MAKMSRDKGARFERRVANLFSCKFCRNIRRTPTLLHENPDLIVGKRIRSDLYSVDGKPFIYFVECKYREDFRISQLLVRNEEKSVLIRIMKSINPEYCTIPILVFKGGDFDEEMVMCNRCDLQEIFLCNISNYRNRDLRGLFTKTTAVFTLRYFLERCITQQITRVCDEDDGYTD